MQPHKISKKNSVESTLPISHTAEKLALHPRNQHRQRYDFPALIKTSPTLAKFVKPNAYGDASIDFANQQAVITLNQALLAHHYGVNDWHIPADYLCPPIPGRADYIHYLADLLSESASSPKPKTAAIRVLDIGTGANLVYPLIGHQTYQWQFVASDIDVLALQNAQEILQANPQLNSAITLRQQPSSTAYFTGIIQANEWFDLSLCNPPFHSSKAEAEAGSHRKVKALAGSRGHVSTSKYRPLLTPALNFGGQTNELICDGGEQAFVLGMIEESKTFAKQVRWFSSLISKSSTLPAVYSALKAAGASQVKSIEMAQGQKKSRFVAWTFIEGV